MVCSHGQRDSRCGILGPVLHNEFRRYLSQRDDRTGQLQFTVSEEGMFLAQTGEQASLAGSGKPRAKDGERHLEEQGQSVVNSTLARTSDSKTVRACASTSREATTKDVTINVGMISHVGGHKWAGNVILYIPPGFSTSDTPPNLTNASQRVYSVPNLHPLAGMSVWYGRVEPRHVEGIVEQTLVKGNVIKELYRGGLDGNGRIVRL